MLAKIKDFFKKERPPQPAVNSVPTAKGALTSDSLDVSRTKTMQDLFVRSFQRKVEEDAVGTYDRAMDEAIDLGVKGNFSQSASSVSIDWLASFSFLGYQVCALLAQHWLINKACTMPGRDAIRKGYEITVNDGTEVAPEVLDAIKKADVRYKLNYNLVRFAKFNRVFGIRIALFQVESDDPDYYLNPFNLDGVTKGSYKGIVQVDPYWVSPELDSEAASNPASINFYEPTWWRISGKRYHRSHLIITRYGEVADILKPTYIYGGVPLPQEIFQRVYCAERTADEAPELALTKRTTFLHVDLAEALANECDFERQMQKWIYYRNNYAVKVLGLDETAEQFDTSLADFDAMIMTQYQLVASIAKVPSVKLLGTSPKGFNTTGEFEQDNYHEELESIQSHELTPLLERHHQLLIRSEIAPQFNLAPFSTTVTWNPLDSLTTKEKAELNKIKADTDAVLVNTGAVDPMDVRQRLVNDPDSGYNGISEEMEPDFTEEDPEENEQTENEETPPNKEA